MAPSHDKDVCCDERIRELLKATPMNVRPMAIVVVISGLIVAAGFSCGCQVPRMVRSWDSRSLPWRQKHEHRPSISDDWRDSETYVPGDETQQTFPQQPIPEQPNLRLPPEPSYTPGPAKNERPVPVPPALELESPQARRWMPSRPYNGVPTVPPGTYESESTSDEFNLPPARVTYNAEETIDYPTITPAPEQQDPSQPRLFRPAGTAKNMYESVKRKFSR